MSLHEERRPADDAGAALKSSATTTSQESTATRADSAVNLADVVPSGGRPKGLVSYRPAAKTKVMIERVLELYARMHDADALPLGPRAAGYRLKESYVGTYTKADFPAIEITIKRLQQVGRIPWTWVSDASSLTYTTDGWGSPADFLRDAHDLYERDLRDRQPTVVEVYTEAKETLPLIARIGAERGVTVYSGSGSAGPNLAHKVAARAVERAVEHGQSTLLLGICDFDQAGIRNVLRPHMEHVAAFCYGLCGNDGVLTWDGKSVWDAAASVSFRQLALTPTMALELVETGDDRDRIGNYLDSGSDLWSRDLNLLDGVQKVETEALDPVELRDLVTTEIESVVDTGILSVVTDEETVQRFDLKRRLSVVADDLAGGEVR